MNDKVKFGRGSRIVWVIVLPVVLLAVLMGGMSVQRVRADASLNIDLSGNTQALYYDHNQADRPPKVGALVATITNNSTETATDVMVALPLPVNTTGNPDPVDGLKLVHGSVVTRLLRSLAPGATTSLFWQVNYPRTDETPYWYTVMAQAGNSPAVSASQIITTVAALSANQVVVDSVDVVSNASVGQVFTETVTFHTATVGAGDEISVQPTGSQDYTAGTATLIGVTYVITSSTEVVSIYADTLQVHDLDGRYVGVAYFTWIATNPGTLDLLPYAEDASGTQFKFNDSGVFVTVTAEAQLSMEKVGRAPSTFPGDLVTYTLCIQNISNYPLENGYFADDIPAYTTYVTDSAKMYGSGYGVQYSTNGRSTYVSTEPVPAASVSTLRWNLDQDLAPGGTFTVQFQVLIAADADPGSFINNVGEFGIGSSPPAITATFDFLPNAVTLTLFQAEAAPSSGGLAITGLIGLLGVIVAVVVSKLLGSPR